MEKEGSNMFGDEEAKKGEKEKNHGYMGEDENVEKEERRSEMNDTSFSLQEKFVKIEGTAKFICQVGDCKKVMHRCSKKEHLRSCHKLFPALK